MAEDVFAEYALGTDSTGFPDVYVGAADSGGFDVEEDFVGGGSEDGRGGYHYFVVGRYVEGGVDVSARENGVVFFDDVADALGGFGDVYDPAWWFWGFASCCCSVRSAAIVCGLDYGGRHFECDSVCSLILFLMQRIGISRLDTVN